MCDSSRTPGPLGRSGLSTPGGDGAAAGAAAGQECRAGWRGGCQRVLEPPRPFGPKPERRPGPRTPRSPAELEGCGAPPPRASDPRKLSRPGIDGGRGGRRLRERGGARVRGSRAGSGSFSKHPFFPPPRPPSACETAPPKEVGGTGRRRSWWGGGGKCGGMKGVGATQSRAREAVLGGGGGEERTGLAGNRETERESSGGAGWGWGAGCRGTAGEEERRGNWEDEAASATWAVPRGRHLSCPP